MQATVARAAATAATPLHAHPALHGLRLEPMRGAAPWYTRLLSAGDPEAPEVQGSAGTAHTVSVTLRLFLLTHCSFTVCVCVRMHVQWLSRWGVECGL